MDKILCNDIQCEKAVLGVLLSYHAAFEESRDILQGDYFYSEKHRYIYNAIKSTFEAGEQIDIIAVSAYFNKHPQDNVELCYIMECAGSVASSVNFEAHCHRLQDLYDRRQLWLIGQQLVNVGTSECTDIENTKTKAVEAIKSLEDSPQASVHDVGEALKQLCNIVNDNLTGTRKNGIPTGFPYLDAKGGLQPCDLVVVAAEFSQGKTSLAIDFTINAAKNGYPVAFYSTEMMGTQLAARMVAADSGVGSREMMQTKLNSEQLEKFDKSVSNIEHLPIYFDDTSTMSVERIISSIRTLTRKKKVKVACIDYLQVLQTNEKSMNRTEEQFFGYTCRKLKNLAKELNICIVLMSQIARSKDTTEPTLSRVRGSGQITEAADVVLLIYRPEFYGKQYSGEFSNVSTTGTALINIAKGRNIGTGAFICGYDAPTTHFFPLDRTSTVSASTSGVKQKYIIDEDRPF